MFDLVTLLRDAAYLAFEDGTNDYTTTAKAANALEAQAARIAELEAALATARRDAMEEAAVLLEQIAVKEMNGEYQSRTPRCVVTLSDGISKIRAALEGKKDE